VDGDEAIFIAETFNRTTATVKYLSDGEGQKQKGKTQNKAECGL
jgi:hypothetical protein